MEKKEKIPRRGLGLLMLSWLAVFVSYFGNFSLGVMLPAMCAELGLNAAVLGGNLSSLGFLVKVLVTLPFSLWAARVNPKWFLGITYVLLGFALILHGLAQHVVLLYAARILLLGASAGITAALAMVKTNWIPKSCIGRINGYENAVSNSGQLIALSFTVPLMEILGGWRVPLALFGGFGLVLSALWFLYYQENPAAPRLAPAGRQPFLEPLKKALHYRSVWLLALGWPGTTLVWIAVTTFWPTYAVEQLGMDLGLAGMLVGLIPIASMTACMTAPRIADWMGVDKLMLCPWGLILPVAYFIPLVTRQPLLIGVCFFIAGYGAFAFVPVAMTHVYKLPGIAPGTISVAIGFILTMTSAGGMLAGVIVKALYASMGLYGAMALCCLAPLTWFATTLFLPEYGRKAMEKQAAKQAEAIR